MRNKLAIELLRKLQESGDMVASEETLKEAVEIIGPEPMRQVMDAVGGTVVTAEEAEEMATMVVCVLAGQEEQQFKADNIYTQCARCKRDITHRPHAPKNPIKVCLECAVWLVREDQANQEAN